MAAKGNRKKSRTHAPATYAPLTEEKLKRVALDYLARFAASEASLREVLDRRILRQVMRDKALAADTDKQAALRAVIDTIIATHKQVGVLNDVAFAETKIASLRRSGASKRRIEQKLAHKGVSKDTIAKTLHAHDQDQDQTNGNTDDNKGDNPNAELQAALTFARKRRLGPFRTTSRYGEKNTAAQSDAGQIDAETQRKQQSRDIAALARAGFSYDTAQRALKINSDFEE